MTWTWVWPVVLVAGLVLLAVGLVLLRRAFAVSADAEGGAAARGPAAAAILDERLARGEIDPAEHERRRRVLDEP